MIYAKSGAVFEAVLASQVSGLVGTIGVRISTAAGVSALARKTTGIAEVPAGSGTYTVSLTAPENEGFYVVTWDTVAGGSPLTPDKVGVEELQVTRIAPIGSVVGFLPDPEDVSAVLVARTFNSGSHEEGEFSATTRPTEGQVQTLINQAGNEVAARLGQEIEDDTLRAYARELIALRAAMGVELSFFPEQTNTEQSAYEHLVDLYEKGLASLIDALPDTASTKKGFYSIHTRSEVAGIFPTSELLP
jgi:hypothetical protein